MTKIYDLSGKRVTIGVTGSISAYKSCELIRLFVKSGADVQVVTTDDSLKFVNVASYYGLTKNKPITTLFDSDLSAGPHITLGQHSDIFVIAPASGNTISKIAHGIADDALSATALAATCACVVCPAMNTHMFNNPATKKSLDILKASGWHVINGEPGEMACGTTGEGRLADVSVIYKKCVKILKNKPFRFGKLKNKRVLITSGPTQEDIDPVRYISNKSSGKMGAALASAFKEAGAHVCVVSGPVNVIYDADEIAGVLSASEMRKEVARRMTDYDLIVCCAAVCDFKAYEKAHKKIKKGKKTTLSLKLKKTPDILKTVTRLKRKDQIVVGFAAETDHYIKYGKQKLKSKKCDMIVANKVGKRENFGKDTAKAAVITRSGTNKLGKCKKTEIAIDVVKSATKMIK